MASPNNAGVDVGANPPAAWLFALLGRRWIRIALVSMGLLVGAGTVWYQVAVKPNLTATRFQVWVAGDDRRLTIGVDSDADTVTISGGQAGLSEIIVVGDLIYVLADEVGVDDVAVNWVGIDLSEPDQRFGVLTPRRLVMALSIDHVECRTPTGDAAIVAEMLLDGAGLSENGASMCGSGVGAAADDGQDVLIDTRRVRPSEVAGAPASYVVAIADGPIAAAVVAWLDQLLPT